MDRLQSETEPSKAVSVRHKCSACYKQYKKKEHLVEHMRISYHSVHQPKCGVCNKYCKSFESVREHITGPLPKRNCAQVFNVQGCDLCMNVFDSPDARDVHKETCLMSPPAPLDLVGISYVENFTRSEMEISGFQAENPSNLRPEVVAMDCEMVGGGSDGSLNICARVCLIDEHENVIFHSYVTPQIPVTDYRYEITGITEDHLRDARPLKQVRETIQEILINGEAIWKMRMEGGKARILVGHDLEHDLYCLQMTYPGHLIRDTALYPPLMKTNLISHSLKYLTKTYLGYDIQSGVHDPYQDCVAAMQLYKKMRAQIHPPEISISMNEHTHNTNGFDGWKPKELEKMSPDTLLEMSRSKYKCWCLDARQIVQS